MLKVCLAVFSTLNTVSLNSKKQKKSQFFMFHLLVSEKISNVQFFSYFLSRKLFRVMTWLIYTQRSMYDYICKSTKKKWRKIHMNQTHSFENDHFVIWIAFTVITIQFQSISAREKKRRDILHILSSTLAIIISTVFKTTFNDMSNQSL